MNVRPPYTPPAVYRSNTLPWAAATRYPSVRPTQMQHGRRRLRVRLARSPAYAVCSHADSGESLPPGVDEEIRVYYSLFFGRACTAHFVALKLAASRAWQRPGEA